MKYILNEEFFDNIPDVLIDPLREDEIELSGPSTDEEFGSTMLIVDSIKSTWDMIDKYNSTLASIENEDIKKVIKDILDIELTNIGKLEEVLKIVSPNAENIDLPEEI